MNLLLKRRRIIASQRGEDTTDYTLLPLTFKCLTGGDLSIKNVNSSYDRNFEYSLNGGAWTAFSLPANTASKLIATLSPNDTISFRRDNDNFADAQFLSDSNLTFNIYGNLLSLQYGSAFNGQTALRNTAKKAFGITFKGTGIVDASNLMLTAPTLSTYCYQGLLESCTNLISAPVIFATQLGNYSLNAMFKNCVNLVTAPELPATTLAEGCYNDMFNGCTSLVNAPELPATTMKKNCYYGMFSGCTGLINAPELPATTLAENCYRSMFQDCTSLISAPELLATTLASGCYNAMFRGCTNLTTAPNLPATTLAKSCYYRMFMGCTSLTTAPELPAKTLVQECYFDLFKNCSRLNYIMCLATDISASFCLSGWVADVSSTGTFIKASGVTWPSGNSGIPNNWTEAVEIDYLESSGYQYINTGILPQDNEIIKVTFQFVGAQSNIIFGSRIGSGSGKITIGSGSSGTQIYAALGTASNPVILPFDQNEHTVILDTGTGYATIDNNTPVNVGVFSETNLQYYLFACNQNGSLQFLSTAKIKYLKIGNRMELVPVRVGSVGYMLDLVSKQLFGNNGTGDFTLGPDKTY